MAAGEVGRAGAGADPAKKSKAVPVSGVKGALPLLLLLPPSPSRRLTRASYVWWRSAPMAPGPVPDTPPPPLLGPGPPALPSTPPYSPAAPAAPLPATAARLIVGTQGRYSSPSDSTSALRQSSAVRFTSGGVTKKLLSAMQRPRACTMREANGATCTPLAMRAVRVSMACLRTMGATKP